MPRILIPKRLLEEIVKKCTGYRAERVFIGIGLEREDETIVEELFECPNVSEIPETRFVADPLCVYSVYKTAEEKGKSIVLLIHSHPAPPVPSVEDLEGMKTSGSLPWLIISSHTGEFRAWVLIGGKPVEVNVHTADQPANAAKP